METETVLFESNAGVKRSFTVEHATRLVRIDGQATWKLTDKKWIVLDGKLVRNKNHKPE